ncbi:hypothetical protein D3C86_1228510 [compost metagenome]
MIICKDISEIQPRPGEFPNQMQLLKSHPDHHKKYQSEIRSLTSFIKSIEVKNHRHKKSVRQNRKQNCQERIAPIRKFGIVKPTRRNSVPNHKRKIGQSKYCQAFSFDITEFRNIVFHHQEWNKRKKYKKWNPVSWTRNGK